MVLTPDQNRFPRKNDMHILECNFDGYASFLFKDAEEEDKWLSPRDRFNLFDGTPRNGKYPVPQGIRNRIGKEKRSNVLPDFTHIGLMPIPTFSERAVRALGDMLSCNGELAPIKMNEAMQYYGFNPTRIVDVVDEEKSTIAYFSSGRLMDIDHYVLRADAKELPPIFRIPQLVRNTTYVSDEFIALVNECKLTGFRFQPLP